MSEVSRCLRSVFQNGVVVIAQDSPPLYADVPVWRDLIPGCGSLGGLYTGLKQAMTPSVFAVACDMPFLDPVTIRYFLTVQGEADLVMAKLPNGLHPMHALYHRHCLPVMESSHSGARAENTAVGRSSVASRAPRDGG